MRIDIKFNIWTMFMILILALFLVAYLILGYKLALINNEYNIKIQELQQSNVKWILNCKDLNYESGMWQCPTYERLYNLTGAYCNKTMVCKNEYEVLR